MRYVAKVEDLAPVDRPMCATLFKYRKSRGFVVVGVRVMVESNLGGPGRLYRRAGA
jgi:hypothetical protein